MVRRAFPCYLSLNAPLLPHLEKLGFYQGTARLDMEQTNEQTKNPKTIEVIKEGKMFKQQVHERCAVHTYVSVNAPFSVLRRKISVNSQPR